MKLLSQLLLISSLLFLGSCKDKSKDTTFNLDVTTKVTLPATFGIELPVDAISESKDTESSSVFTAENTEAGLLTEASVKSIQLVLNSPTSGNFNYLDEVNVFINANGLTELKVATMASVEPDIAIINFTELEVDVLDFVKASAISFRVNFTSDDYENVDHECEIYSVFEVNGATLD